MIAEETIQSLITSLETLRELLQSQAHRIHQLERERNALVAHIEAMMVRHMTSEASAIDLVED